MTPSPVIERHYDYVFNLASLTAGSAQSCYIKLDAECPFAVRGRAIYAEGGSSKQASTLQISTQWKNAVDQYLSSFPMLAQFDIPFAGYNGIFSPVHPQVPFPAGGILQTDISYPAALPTLSNVNLIYRGVRVYPPGAAPLARTLPDTRVDLRPWSQQFQITLQAVDSTNVRVPINFTGTGGDYIIRGITCGTQSTPRYSSVMVTLRDSLQKPYSSAPVPLDYLCGNSSATTNGIFEGVQTGSWTPGLIYPEIYLLRNDQLFIDLIRNDIGGVPNLLTFNFWGCRVVPA